MSVAIGVLVWLAAGLIAARLCGLNGEEEMKPSLVRHAVRLFPHTVYSERAAVKHLRREYVKARTYLGERWILAKRIGRKINSDGAVMTVCVAGGLPLFAWDVAQKVMA